MARTPDSVVFVSLGRNKCGKALGLTALALLAIGVMTVHSVLATVAQTDGAWYTHADMRHTLFAGVAAVVLLVGWLFDYRWLALGGGRWRKDSGHWPVVALVLLCVSLVCGLLVYVPGIGHAVHGSYRWIRIGPARYAVGFQPSELIKISLVVFLAAWLTRPGVNPRSFVKTFLPAAIVIGVCVAVVIDQDFGTGIVIGTVGMVTLLLVGVPVWHLLTLLPVGAALAYVKLISTPYRLARLTVMGNIWTSEHGSAYQPRQSLLTIINGGWWGKGLGNGTMKHGFLPEDSTDFIFAALCEEWGFVGGAVVLLLIVLWIRYSWQIALDASDRFGQTLAGALGFLVGLQALMHVGIDVVVLPPTGMALPFVSAGGTSLVLMAGAAALIMSVSARHRIKDPLA